MRQKLRGRLPGPILLLIGLNILLFVHSGQYWTLLNPKYAMVTAGTGYACGLIGAILVIRPPAFQRQTLLSALLILCLLGGLNMSLWLNPRGGASTVSLSEHMDRLFSRETRFDKEYIKINIAELTTLIENDSPDVYSQNFLFRGQIYRSGDGEYLVLRTAVACCLADAVSVGIRVGADTSSSFVDGQWVKVYGRVKDDPVSRPLNRHLLRVTGFMTVIQPGAVIQAEALEETDPPDLTMMFQFRREEPYAY